MAELTTIFSGATAIETPLVTDLIPAVRADGSLGQIAATLLQGATGPQGPTGATGPEGAAGPMSPDEVPRLRHLGVRLNDFSTGLAALSFQSAGAGATISAGSDANGPFIRVQTSGPPAATFYDFTIPATRINDGDTLTLVCSTNLVAAMTSLTIFVGNSGGTGWVTGSVGFGNVNPFEGGPATILYPVSGLTVTGSGFAKGDEAVKVRIRLEGPAAGLDFKVYALRYNAVTAPACMVSVDDGYVSAYSEIASYMARLGIRASYGIVTNNVGQAGYVTWDMLREMRDAGHAIGNHTSAHQYSVTGAGAASAAGPIDQIAQNQTVAAGASFTLNGSTGSAAFDAPRHVVFQSAGNDQQKRFVVTGLDVNGNALIETVIGRNVAAYMSVGVFSRVTSIVATDGTGANTRVGFSRSYAEILSDYGTAQDALVAEGFADTAHCAVLPGGEISPLTRQALNALGITHVRTVADYNAHPGIWGGYGFLPGAISGIASGGSAAPIAVAQRAVDHRCLTGVYLHNIIDDSVGVTGTNSRRADLRLFLDDLASKVRSGALICPTMKDL